MLTTLRIRDFRNYESLAMEFGPGIHVIAGRNAQGKTNLVEAIHLISTGKLLRSGRDGDAIRHGAASAEVHGVLSETRSVIEVTLAEGKRKRVTVNSASLPRASDLMGRLPSVSFSAADLGIVRGEPSERRLFLDLALSQVSPAYLQHLGRYKRALDQRNALLRQAQETEVGAEQFEVWEDEMARHGSALRQLRAEFVADLAEEAGQLDAGLAAGESLVLRYEAVDEARTPEELSRRLAENRRADTMRGSSLVGPHRDEMAIAIDGRLAKTYGSQGQQRSAAIALKLGVLALTRARLSAEPILLLDDVFSDLDQGRRANLLSIGQSLAGQIVITCTEAEQAGSDILGRASVYLVHQGTIAKQ